MGFGYDKYYLKDWVFRYEAYNQLFYVSQKSQLAEKLAAEEPGKAPCLILYGALADE